MLLTEMLVLCEKSRDHFQVFDICSRLLYRISFESDDELILYTVCCHFFTSSFFNYQVLSDLWMWIDLFIDRMLQ